MRTKSRPEGSIAEGYLVEECMNFCSRYLGDVESLGNSSRGNHENFENICKGEGCVIGGIEIVYMETTTWTQVYMETTTWAQAHRYVLENCDMLTPFRE